MKRILLITAALAILPAGAAFAAPTSACPTAWLLQQADDPHSCFKTGRTVEQQALAPRGALGPARIDSDRAGASQQVPFEIRHSYGDFGWYRDN